MTILSLCAARRPKYLDLVSSTPVKFRSLRKSPREECGEGGTGVSEADGLEGSRKDLGSGYGQSKWDAEYPVRQAGKRGLKGAIIRPSYVTGDPKAGSK